MTSYICTGISIIWSVLFLVGLIIGFIELFSGTKSCQKGTQHKKTTHYNNSASNCGVVVGNQNYANQMYQQQFSQQFADELNREQMRIATEESLKSVTPFEMGGYDTTQGNSFNEPTFDPPMFDSFNW